MGVELRYGCGVTYGMSIVDIFQKNKKWVRLILTAFLGQQTASSMRNNQKYSTAIFFQQNTHKTHPISHPHGQAMGVFCEYLAERVYLVFIPAWVSELTAHLHARMHIWGSNYLLAAHQWSRLSALAI